jgi:hypothetical protein
MKIMSDIGVWYIQESVFVQVSILFPIAAVRLIAVCYLHLFIIDLIHTAAILNPERGRRCAGHLRCTGLYVR